MRKQIIMLMFALTIVMVACHDDIQLRSPSIATRNSDIRSMNEIIELANEAAALLDDNSRAARSVTSTNAIIPIYTKVTRADDENPDIYIVNYDNDCGYAIINAHKSQEAILGVVEDGSYSTTNDNPGLSIFLNMSVDAISSDFLRRDTLSFDTTNISGSGMGITQVGPLLSVKWGQRNPYGSLCPNNISGCANTALAQIMTYYKYPESIATTYPEATVDSINLNWNNILTHKKSTSSDTFICCFGSDTHSQISMLLRELGHRSNSNYKTNSTSTPVRYIRSTATSLGYNVSSYKNYVSSKVDCCVEDALDGGLMLVIGYDNTTNPDSISGHVWVVDGYKHYEPQDMFVNSCYVHVNWGWNGADNGYYYSGVFNTAEPVDLDDDTSVLSVNRNYSSNVFYCKISH